MSDTMVPITTVASRSDAPAPAMLNAFSAKATPKTPGGNRWKAKSRGTGA